MLIKTVLILLGSGLLLNCIFLLFYFQLQSREDSQFYIGLSSPVLWNFF